VEEEEKIAQNLLRLFCLVKSFESHFVLCRMSYVVSKKTQKVIHLISLWFQYVCHINYSQSSSQLGLLQIAGRQCQLVLDLLTPV